MQFEIYRSNSGQIHSCLVGDDGARLRVSALAFGTARDAHTSAADVAVHAGSANGTEVR